MDPQDKRDELIERARHGLVSGADSDTEAIRLGLGSLSQTPALEDFRPETTPQWTIPMAVAWISYLDLDEVREWSAPYREACWHWVWRRWRVGFEGPVNEGWFLEQRAKPTLALLEISATFDRAQGGGREIFMTIADAREALWIALREGFFAAHGIDLETGRRVEIPALDWHELEPVQGKGEIDEVRRGLLNTGYSDVLVPAVALRGFWRKKENVRTILPDLIPPIK